MLEEEGDILHGCGIVFGMTSLENLLEPIRHSPRLPEVVSELQRQIEAESKRRLEFYENMTPEEKVEFIDGEVILHSPARNRHLDTTKYILKLLDSFVSLHQLGTVKSEKCLCVFPRNDYAPDVVFFGPEKAANLDEGTMRFPPPDLVVEVLSDSTKERDRGVKFEDFEVNQVGEYWIVDPAVETLEQFLPESGSFALNLKSGSGLVQSSVIKGFQCEIPALFDEQKNLAALQAILQSGD